MIPSQEWFTKAKKFQPHFIFLAQHRMWFLATILSQFQGFWDQRATKYKVPFVAPALASAECYFAPDSVSPLSFLSFPLTCLLFLAQPLFWSSPPWHPNCRWSHKLLSSSSLSSWTCHPYGLNYPLPLNWLVANSLSGSHHACEFGAQVSFSILW